MSRIGKGATKEMYQEMLTKASWGDFVGSCCGGLNG